MPERIYSTEEIEDAVRACLMDIVPDIDAWVVRASPQPNGGRYVRLGVAGRDLEIGVMVQLGRGPVAPYDVPAITRLAYDTLQAARAERREGLTEIDYVRAT